MKTYALSTVFLNPPDDSKGFIDMFSSLLNSWKYLFTGVFAVGTLVIIAAVIFSFSGLSRSAGNPQKLQKAKTKLFYSLAALVVLGGLMFFSGIMFSILK